MSFSLIVLDNVYAVSKLPYDEEIPSWLGNQEFSAVIRARNELSIVCMESLVPSGVLSERGWKVLEVVGPLPFSLIGIMADITRLLAEAGVSVFVLSSYDTDYLLIKQDQLKVAIDALEQAGNDIQEEEAD
jgi:hypothetical protein